VKLNVGQTGFYRVKYSDEMLAALGGGVEDMSLGSVDRLSVQADAFQLAKAGKVSTSSALAIADKQREMSLCC